MLNIIVLAVRGNMSEYDAARATHAKLMAFSADMPSFVAAQHTRDPRKWLFLFCSDASFHGSGQGHTYLHMLIRGGSQIRV